MRCELENRTGAKGFGGSFKMAGWELRNDFFAIRSAAPAATAGERDETATWPSERHGSRTRPGRAPVCCSRRRAAACSARA